jgi:hypothetical protein
MIEVISPDQYDRRQAVAETELYRRIFIRATDPERRYVVALDDPGAEINAAGDDPGAEIQNPYAENLGSGWAKILADWPSDGSADMDAHYRNTDKPDAGRCRAVSYHELRFEDRVVYHARKTPLCRKSETFQEVVDAIHTHYENQYREAAIRLHHDEGTCEIDDNADISWSGDDGVYVKAWVWVPNDELSNNATGEEDTDAENQGA